MFFLEYTRVSYGACKKARFLCRITRVFKNDGYFDGVKTRMAAIFVLMRWQYLPFLSNVGDVLQLETPDLEKKFI